MERYFQGTEEGKGFLYKIISERLFSFRAWNDVSRIHRYLVMMLRITDDSLEH